MFKKYWKFILLVLLILITVSWIWIREGAIKRQAKRITELEYANFVLDKDRQTLGNQLKKLQNDYLAIQTSNDSMKLALGSKQKELKSLIEKHKAEIAELTNIPPDTVFKRLQARFNNYDNLPLLYPFSASQIKPIYSTVISFDMVSQEYVLQGKALNSCLDLNRGYESGILNLNSQIGNLKENIIKADRQIVNYKSEVNILSKKIKRKSIWNYSLMGLAGIAVGYALIK
jgi:peptidoglycan hydrolase CwlO-like protein